MRSALWLPTFDGLADPAVVARLAAEAEQAGWHGVLVWDHRRWRAPVRQVADPWITLVAIATATHHRPPPAHDGAVRLRRGSGAWYRPSAYAAAGATWWLVEFPWDTVSVDRVRGVLRDGPAAP